MKYVVLFAAWSISLFSAEPEAPRLKKTICLNMIVKNENHVIERCLESVLPIIDTWVIVDTGSTDGTQQKIKDYLRNVPGVLYERPWVNFEHNREEALQLANPKADYILFMDADDKLSFAPGFLMPELTEDFYAVWTRYGGTDCLLPRIVKANSGFHWQGVLHECLISEKEARGVTLLGVDYLYLSDGARARDPNRYQRDIDILQQALAKDPENSRNVFFLAKTYLAASDFTNALKTFQKRATMNGKEEEVFLSKLEIARIHDHLKVDPSIITNAYLEAFKYRPTRAEPLYYLAIQARQQGLYQKGYEIAKLALQLSPSDSQFVEQWIYAYGLLFEYSVSAGHLGKYQESLEACDKVLAQATFPEKYRKDVLSHRQEIERRQHQLIEQQLLELMAK